VTVSELIKELQKLPSEFPACIWVEKDDEYVEVTYAIYEDGCPEVHLETGPVPEMIEVPPESA
jgi:hypothetical protein